MTVNEIVEIADFTARYEGWQLAGDVDVVKTRRLFGPAEWRVSAAGPTPDSHRWVRIDDRSGDVIASGWRAI
ncbi:MAG: hypothetical protein A2289_20980 [Deltaproteobacteria bacterium RIFOXYA12_FULL_58_15]|nr:MAG: hypothetical protein A2289_20980 [Deltaproteobacteria bacterium RIFOXYA12_FULL_58_15]OGR13434.1 MAG: hypothetical protein A2341_07020 [Deltaproteobacteria bacterium RIFOXYB12_FULL_58_9]